MVGICFKIIQEKIWAEKVKKKLKWQDIYCCENWVTGVFRVTYTDFKTLLLCKLGNFLNTKSNNGCILFGF